MRPASYLRPMMNSIITLHQLIPWFIQLTCDRHHGVGCSAARPIGLSATAPWVPILEAEDPICHRHVGTQYCIFGWTFPPFAWHAFILSRVNFRRTAFELFLWKERLNSTQFKWNVLPSCICWRVFKLNSTGEKPYSCIHTPTNVEREGA